MPQPTSQDVTQLLREWRAGDQDALEALVPLVYKELHSLAHYCLHGERSQHTLQSTALVHEAYLRLVDQSPVQSDNRAHFFAIAARLMRQILVDYARSRRAAKRGVDCTVQLDTAIDEAYQGWAVRRFGSPALPIRAAVAGHHGPPSYCEGL